jgi:hypothetical protein
MKDESQSPLHATTIPLTSTKANGRGRSLALSADQLPALAHRLSADQALVHNLLLLVRFRRSVYCVARNLQWSREVPRRSAGVMGRDRHTLGPDSRRQGAG